MFVAVKLKKHYQNEQRRSLFNYRSNLKPFLKLGLYLHTIGKCSLEINRNSFQYIENIQHA